MPVRLLLALVIVVGLQGCKDGLVEPERFGSIRGQVLDFDTGAILPGAVVTTSPATDAVLVGDDGSFTYLDVLAGAYTITARKAGYEPNTVTVQVRDSRVAEAVVFLDESQEEAPPESSLETEILGFRTESVTPDSSFVTVDYRVRNAGEAAFTAYEVYFRVDTSSGEAFYEEVAGEDLRPGERDVRTFTEQIRGQTATEVVVEGSNVQVEGG